MNATTPRRLPMFRAECERGPRPCPHVTCRHHLDSRYASCSLDIAEGGPVSVREVARLLGTSRVNVERIERIAVAKARASAKREGVGREDLAGFSVGRQWDHVVPDDDTRDGRVGNLKTHVCLSCHELFMSPDRNETQRLFCGPVCRGDR